MFFAAATRRREPRRAYAPIAQSHFGFMTRAPSFAPSTAFAVATWSLVCHPVFNRADRSMSSNVRRFMTPREPSDSSAEGCPAPLPSYPFSCLRR